MKFMVDELLHEKDATSNSVKEKKTMEYYHKGDKKSTELSFCNGVCVGIVLTGVVVLFVMHYIVGVL